MRLLHGRLTNFPALIVLGANNIEGFDYNQFEPGNIDLRFSDSTGTIELPYEIDSWDPNGDSYVWVKVPELTGTETSIFAYWNAPFAEAPDYTTSGGVWSEGYEAVWHLGGEGMTRADSSGNGFTGTLDATGVAATSAGIVGGADVFTGSGTTYPTSGGIDCGNVSVTGSLTTEMWIKVDNRSQRRNPMNKAYGGEGTIVLETDGRIIFYHGTAGSDASPYQEHGAPAGTVPVGQWMHTAIVRDLSSPETLRWFVNGNQITSVSSTINPAKASTRNMTLGKGYVYAFNGAMDEVRVSAKAHSADWINASYLNMISNDVFQSYSDAFSVTPGLAMIAMDGATNITVASAWLNGNLVSTGDTATAVTAYWGTTDWSTNASNWANSITLAAPQSEGPFTAQATGLAANSTYYYAFSASNDAGYAWTRTENFITGDVGISVSANADEATLATGSFTVTRPATATDEPLVVTYEQTGGTAVSGVDFVALSGTVTIPAGEDSATITVTPLKNHAVSADTSLEITLTDATAILGASTTATMTIVNQALLTNVYVSQTGSNGDGLSWATALTSPQAALDVVASNGKIHIAGGQTYSLSSALMWPSRDGISLVGGYAASGAAPDENDPYKWPTILQPLSGQAIRILTINGVAGATLENLTIQKGNITDASAAYGGAVYASAVSDLTVRNCRFLRNNAIAVSGYGGGLAAVNSSGMITNCLFSGNYAATTTGHGTGSRGGGFYLSGGAWTLRDLVVVGDFTGASSGSYRGCIQDMAGGIFLGGTGGAFHAQNLLVVNCDGGGIRVDAGSATLENITVSGCDPNGISIAPGAAAGTVIRNSIIHGNRADLFGTVPTLHYNIIGDGTGAGFDGNLAADPKFAFPLFYLDAGSPAINSGTGTVVEAGLAETTVLIDGTLDGGTVSRGYHFTSGVVWDSILHVAPGGTGDGSSPASPLGSITSALAQGGNRSQIHLAAGTYTKATETFPLSFSGRTIQLLGTNALATVIDASGSGKRVVEVLDAIVGDNRITGVTLRGGSTSLGGGGVIVDCAALSVQDAILRNNTAYVPGYDSKFGGGGLYAVGSSVMIKRLHFIENVAANTAGHIDGRAGGLDAWSAVTLRVRDSVFSGNITRKSGGTSYSVNGGGGVWLGRGFFQLRNLLLSENIGGGVVVGAATTLGGKGPGVSTLENLTAVDNNAAGIRVESEAAPTCAILNSIAYGNVVTNFAGTVPAVFMNNCTGDGLLDGVNGNISADPLFVDAANGDYRLATGSPCINAGSNQPWMAGATDLAGLRRIMAGSVDIGAYEWEPPAATLILIK